MTQQFIRIVVFKVNQMSTSHGKQLPIRHESQKKKSSITSRKENRMRLYYFQEQKQNITLEFVYQKWLMTYLKIVDLMLLACLLMTYRLKTFCQHIYVLSPKK